MRTRSHCIEAVSWIQNAVIQFGWLWKIMHFWGLLFLSVKSTAKLSQGSAVRGTETQKWGYSFGDCSAGVKLLKSNHIFLKFSVDWTNKKIILGQWLVSGRQWVADAHKDYDVNGDAVQGGSLSHIRQWEHGDPNPALQHIVLFGKLTFQAVCLSCHETGPAFVFVCTGSHQV